VPAVEWLARPARPLGAADVSLQHDRDRHFGLHRDVLSEQSAEFAESKARGSLGAMGWSPRQVELAIEPLRAIWARRDATRNFNGEILRLESFVLADERLTLRTGRTSWWTLMISNFALRRDVDGIDTRLLGEALAPESRLGIRPDAKLANSLAVHVTAVTADDKLVLVKRGNQSTDAGLWAGSSSGSIQPRDASPFDAAKRELAEELGVDAAVDRLRLQALVVRAPERDPILLFRARLAVTFDELWARRHEAIDSYETTRVVPLELGAAGRDKLLNGFSVDEATVPGGRRLEAWQQIALAGILLTLDDPPPPA
jgi:ADP-ribose pyrophosphatase YjhB (NUDIX family)